MIFAKTQSTQIINTAFTTILSRYQSIRNLTTKMKTDRILSHHIFTHQNSAIIHHFFHHLMKAVLVFMFSSLMVYINACFQMGQNIDIHNRKITTVIMINHKILNL